MDHIPFEVFSQERKRCQKNRHFPKTQRNNEFKGLYAEFSRHESNLLPIR